MFAFQTDRQMILCVLVQSLGNLNLVTLIAVPLGVKD